MQSNHDLHEARISARAPNLGQKVNRLILLFGFFTLVLLPTVFFGHPGAAERDLRENRQLAEFPRASLFFFQRLEKWYADHFGGRATLIYHGARWQMDWIGIPGNRNVVLGPDNWLFYDQYYRPGKALFADFRGRSPFRKDQLQVIRANLLSTQRALAACHIGFYLVMPPDKQTIYSDMMPFGRTSQIQTRADQLFEILETEPELRAVDLRHALQTARAKETLPLYFKTDTHWNALGAYHGVQTLLQAMKSDRHVTADSVPREAYELSSMPYAGGDISVSLLSLPNYFADTKIRMTIPGDKTDLLDDVRQHYRNETHTGRLLLYGDSFSELMPPFLSQSFGEVKVLRKARVDAKDLRTFQPDVVVLEVLERLIAALEDGPIGLPSCPPAR